MWLREVKRFIRSKSRIVGALGQPLLFLIALGYGLGPVFAKAGQGNYLEFIAPGIIGMSIIFTAIFNGMQVIWDRQFGFLKETMVAPVSRLSIMFGRTLGGATVSTAQGVLVLILAIVAGFRPFSLVGIVPAIRRDASHRASFQRARHHGRFASERYAGIPAHYELSRNAALLSFGRVVSVNNVPSALLLVARFDPLSYGIDALRYFLISTATFPLALDFGVLAAVTAIFLGLGSYFFSKIEI